MTAGVSFRAARKADASDIALLVNIAAHGGPARGWASDAAAEGTYDPIEVGRVQMLRNEGAFNWRSATMAESDDGEIVGMLLGYREPDRAEPTPAGAPPFFVPLYELEAAAAGHWYINMLAVYLKWRNQGFGGKLLDVAERKRDETDACGLALIVEDVNIDARRLYERRGFSVGSTRKMVRFPAGGPAGKDWLLMVKE